jgi:hypothetical protein
VEANCHFLEFPAPKTHAVRSARELSAQPKASSGLALAASRQGATQLEGFGDGGAMRAAKRAEARRQAIGRQVRLYCFRLDNCGTFMPLSRVRGESRISVVWTLFVRSLLRSCTGSLQRSVHTRGSSFGGELQVER